MDQTIGSWAFIIGVLIAILGGIFAPMLAEQAAWITLVLVILGLIVGFLNIGDKEVPGFLMATIALMLVGSADLEIIDKVIAPVGTYLASIVANIVAFVAPAALVVALLEIYRLASTPKGTTAK
ncbi:MAG: hypothetical protein DRO07_02695 [Candidatus Iainarchaeum archaeon]|uniref:Uncharacterized protein n=1 Tax=Candidatus Iainarchaeum sp. TaxID=3101447 RepID=A0A497JF66_9ARCH|nr:MAG: hypothetical protein DRO07_02695 [Candidatus Diapherotrites archaeon]